MMAIGEETGEIEEMLDKLADYYDERGGGLAQTVLALRAYDHCIHGNYRSNSDKNHGTNAFVIQRRWKYVEP